MDAELRHAKMEELLPRLQEAVRLNHVERWSEAKALLLDLHASMSLPSAAATCSGEASWRTNVTT